jgi:hypothetical protein
MIKPSFKTHSLLLLYGAISTCAYVYLSFNSQYYADATLIQLWVVSSLCAAISITAWHHCFKSEQVQCLNSPIFLIIGFAIIFRIIGISSFPILEDDFYRYLWDGRMTIETGSPYGIIPSTFFTNDTLSFQFEKIIGLINHPNVATIYGPVNQYIFALGYFIAPGEIWPLQLIFSLADIGIIIILTRLVKPSFVLLYAWSPLIIKEFAFTAHPDVLGAFFILLAFYIYRQKSWFWIGVFLAFATGVKIFALIAAPLLLRLNWRAWLIFFATAILISLPFGIKDAWIPESLGAMASDWLFNAPLYTALLTFYSINAIKLSLLAVFSLIAVSYFFYLVYKQHYKNQQMPIRADCLYAAFFLCIPAFNPWYLVWLLPIAALYPSRWAWTASVSLLFAYGSGINLIETQLALYQLPSYVLIVEFGIIFIALLFDLKAKQKSQN